MKVAIYARVSMDETFKDDKRYQEPENQLEPLRNWAKVQGWEVHKEYVDRGSGADPNREQFRLMMHEGMMNRFNLIIVWKLDRFSREQMSQVVGRIEKLRERGVGIQSLTESWLNTSKDNPMSELILAVMAWASNLERQKISERTKAGIQRLKNIGAWKGGRPRKTPDILLVCNKQEDNSYVCKKCEKKFKDEDTFVRKWNAHQKRHDWLDKHGLIEKVPLDPND
jgi:site-specific DNA recombinase